MGVVRPHCQGGRFLGKPAALNIIVVWIGHLRMQESLNRVSYTLELVSCEDRARVDFLIRFILLLIVCVLSVLHKQIAHFRFANMLALSAYSREGSEMVLPVRFPPPPSPVEFANFPQLVFF